MAQITEVPPPRRRKSAGRDLLETFLLALAIAMAIRWLVVEVYKVEGNSMERTLHTGERVLVNKFVFRIMRQPQPGDIVVFRYPRQPDRNFIKRVVALAGDKVEMRAGKVYVNGERMPEAPTVIASEMDSPPQVVPEDSVWVLGDNRNNSEDSRFFGEVPLTHIRGLAFLRFWPLHNWTIFQTPTLESAG